MALLRSGKRLVDTFAFATTRQTMKIQVPDRFIRMLVLNLRGTLTISGVVVPGVPHLDGPSRLLENFELLQDGKTLKNSYGGALLRVAQKYTQAAGINNGLISGAAGAYDFQCVVPVFFESPASVSPVDTLIDGRNVSVMTANLTWGTAANLIVGNTSTLALTNVTCEVYMVDTEPFPTAGPFWSLREIETTYLNIVTSGQTLLAIPFQPGAIMRAIQLRAIDGANLSDAIINSLSLRLNGSELPFNQIEDDAFQGISLYEAGSILDPEGYYHAELAENGKPAMTGLGAKLSGQAVNDVDMILNTTVGVGATSIVAHTVEHVPPGAL